MRHKNVINLHRMVWDDVLDVGTMTFYIIAFLFAFYGIYHLIQDIIIRIKVGCNAFSGKLCLIPHPGDEGLEGKIRLFLLKRFLKGLALTDGFI